MALAAPFPAARPAAARPTRTGSARPRSSRSQSGIVLTRRGRVVLASVSALFLLAVITLSGLVSADAGSSLADQGRSTGVVVVQEGESLWQIAQAIAPDVDPRATVTAIRELNGLGDSTVIAGQSVVVPLSS